MPSQQPPHLLSTPKLTLERERDSMSSSNSQDWSSNNNNNNINLGTNTATTTTNTATTLTSPASNSSVSPPGSTNITNISNPRNRRGSSASTSASSPAASFMTSYSSAHLSISSSSLMQSSFQSSTSDPGTSTTGTEYTARISKSSHPSRTQDSIEHRHQGHSNHFERQLYVERSAHPLPHQPQTPLLSTNNASDHLLTPVPRRRQRTQSSHSRSRSHTPSVQLALANPTLSKSLSSSPVPSRSGSRLDQQADAKHSFERNVRRYYYQLTVGCQQNNCTNRFCRSSKCSPKMTKDAAAILSIQLAARPRLFFCLNCPTDPIINMPDSPLPMTIANDSRSPLQRRQGLSSKTMAAKLSSSATSCRSSPGAAASVEDLGHSKGHRRLYEPNEYSKSVPSFSVSHILSPTKNTQIPSTIFQDQDEPAASAHPTPPPIERGGTPLFRSLLSVSPFSAMFSPVSSPSLSYHRNKMNKSHELYRNQSSSPSLRIKKSLSAGEMTHRNDLSKMRPSISPTRKGATFEEGFQPSHRLCSFSPTHPIPPSSPVSSSVEAKSNFQPNSQFCKNDLPLLSPEQDQSTESVSLLGEESLGLGYSSRLFHSPVSLGFSRLYQSQPRSEESIQRSSQKQELQSRRDGASHNRSSMTRPMFGSSKDPDSDGLDSPSSADDEYMRSGVQQWKGQQPQSRSPQFLLSSKQQPITQSTYIAKNKLRCGSVSSLSSEEENTTDHRWMLRSQPMDRTTYGELSSSSSSRRSSISASDDEGVALPYLNSTLLRQAIATYNSSKPGNDMRSPQLLICKGFKPTTAVTGLQSFENETEQDDRESHYRRIQRPGHEESLEGDLKIPSFEESEFPNDIVLEYQTVAAGKPIFPEDELRNLDFEDDTDGKNSFGSDPRQDRPDCISLNEGVTSPTFGSDLGDNYSRRRFGSPAQSVVSSSTYSTEGDSTFLVDSLRSVFSSADALGSSFLMKDREESPLSDRDPASGGVDVGGIDLEALRDCYEMMIELKPRTIFAIQVTNSMEILLARLELEQDMAAGNKDWTEQEMRAIIILLMNPFLFDPPYQESLLRRTLQIFTAFSDSKKLIQWLSCMDEDGMAQLVRLFKAYLIAHFTPRPMGDTHPAICAVKALSILYEANNISTRREQEKQRRLAIKDAREGRQSIMSEMASIISFKYFYSSVMEALKFKDEYQIWREGWGKSPLEKPFSYFDYPFLLSPTSKAHILNLDALTQMSAHYEDACVRHALADHAQRLLPETMTTSSREFQKGIRAGSSPYLVLELSRSRLVEEAFEQITKKHADLKKPLKVAFVDVGEEGMDQGGVTKEFFQIMVEKVFDSQFGLFKELEETRSWWFEGILDGSFHVEMTETDIRIRLVEYELVGILVGLALYNGVILGVRFPTVVYRKLLGWEVELEAFIESFPALGNGLEQMLTWTDGDVYDVFMREFEISYEHLGQVTTLPLKPGGQDIAVTNDNREEYVRAYMDHYINQHTKQEFEAFQKGFEKVCGGEALKLLRPEELELLLCGNSDIDMHDLEASCLYDDGYNPSHTLIKEFWEIVHEDLSPIQHKHLLVFVTGSDRVPIRGLKDLMFVIQRNGPDSDRLPTALTCFSRLLLPEYSSKEKMKERLVTAIENSTGFGLV